PLYNQYDFLHQATLHWMRWTKNSQTGEWVRREGGDPPAPPPRDHPDEQSFEERMLAQFGALNARFDSQNLHLSNISQTLETQGTRLSNLELQFTHLVQLIKPPQPPQ